VGAAVVSAFDVVALIVGIFFVVGIAVGFLAVMAIPAFGQAWANRRRPVGGFHADPMDQPDLGPPTEPMRYQEPDDRDEYPWWPSPR
jgi:hypothetical protein